MKKVILAVLAMVMFSVGVSYADVYVHGYTKSNGTYVAPHVRSSPDAYKWNNYGYQK